MYKFVIRCGFRDPMKIVHKVLTRSAANLMKLPTVLEKQKLQEIKMNHLNVTSVNQARTATATATATVTRGEAIPLNVPMGAEVSQEIFEIPEAKSTLEVTEVNKSALAFEEIPGPTILKIWEKYWKYVPLLGTQLLSSLLINSLTEGKLTWNRNITPLKFLFNEYGPVVRINGPMLGDIVLIHRPEHSAEVLRQEGDSPTRSGIDVLQHYRQHHRKSRLPGPFSMRGSDWIEIKSKLERPLAQQLSRYSGRLHKICDEFAHRIRRIRNRQDEVPGDFDKELSRWGMESFSVLMFNKRLGFLDPTGLNSESSRIIDALTTAHVYMSRCESGFQVWRFFETPNSRKLFAACDVIDGLAGKFIRQAQNGLKEYSSNLGAVDDSSPILVKLLTNQKMHPDDISALLMDMMILGVQATVNTQAFLLYFLAKNPRIQRKLHEEISSAQPESGGTFAKSSLMQMTYLKACLRECLRLRPAFPFISRLLPKTITLHGYTIPEGTYVIMANQLSSQREENFEDPEKFKPERWLNDEVDDCSWQKFSCLPFGHGIRSCLGKTFAEMEILLLTAMLVREFRIEYDYTDIESKHLMVNVPNKPLRFRFVDRH